MKRCTKCGELKPASEYNKKKSRLDCYCRECNKIRQREWYSANRTKKVAYSKARMKVIRKKVKVWIESIKQCRGCAVCDEGCAACLDFHHPGEKEFSICQRRDVSLARVMSEVAKCILLCANCHRKLHAGLMCLMPNILPLGCDGSTFG